MNIQNPEDNLETVIILIGENKYEIEINSSIFDDYKLEACTQIIEKLFELKDYKVTPYMYCEYTKNNKINIATYNTYKIIVNAGFHDFAERLRHTFLKSNNINLADEPIEGGKS